MVVTVSLAGSTGKTFVVRINYSMGTFGITRVFVSSSIHSANRVYPLVRAVRAL